MADKPQFYTQYTDRERYEKTLMYLLGEKGIPVIFLDPRGNTDIEIMGFILDHKYPGREVVGISDTNGSYLVSFLDRYNGFVDFITLNVKLNTMIRNTNMLVEGGTDAFARDEDGLWCHIGMISSDEETTDGYIRAFKKFKVELKLLKLRESWAEELPHRIHNLRNYHIETD